MQQTVFTIEVLEERIAPSTMSLGAADPSSGNTAASPGIGADPPWNQVWTANPPSPGQWPVC